MTTTAGENSDADYRSLAEGYLTRARRALSALEKRRGRLGVRAGFLSVFPPVLLAPIAAAIPNIGQLKVWLVISGLVVGIATAAFSVGRELLNSKEKTEAKKEAARSLIADLEAVPTSGPLSAWHRQVVDEASATIQGLRDFMEQ